MSNQVSNPLELSDYKQEIADLYSRRSPTYDAGAWHPEIAHRLVDYAKILPGQTVLDIATGTGLAAIESAQRVGAEGRVVGIDISTGMLEQAQRKAEALSLSQVEFQLADAEALDFPNQSFDRILCSSAFIWMTNLVAALSHWRELLKSGGQLGFHAFAETSFISGVVTRNVAEKHGISYRMNQPTVTIEKCRALLEAAGYEAIEIHTEQDGSYMDLEQAKQLWAGFHPAPGQFPHPFSHLSPEQLAQIQAEFETELEAISTTQGVWNEITIFYMFGRKP